VKIIATSKKNPFANPGAASNRLIGLLKGLSNNGNEVHLIILGGYYSVIEVSEFAEKGTQENIHYLYLSKRKNINIWQRRLSEYVTKKWDILLLQTRIKRLISLSSEKKIVWVENDFLSFNSIKFLLKDSNLKFFMEINEYPDIHISNKSTKYFWQANTANKHVTYFFKNILPKLDGIALMTNNLVKYFEDKVSSKTNIMHLPMTVDLERFDLSKSYESIEGLDSPYIAFIGSMNDTKDGVNLLIEAFGEISKEYPNYKLALYGFWTYDTPKHFQRIHELGIQNKVIYSKPIDSDKVINLIMNSEILVLPRPDSYQAKGGFPTKLGEYLASSKPVIVTKVGEIPNYLQHHKSAFLIEPGSVESIVFALKNALSDYEEASKIGLEGRKVAESQFCANIQSERLNQFLTKKICSND
jgi:glycosyltransferase involved in cell wall biosynthesis